MKRVVLIYLFLLPFFYHPDLKVIFSLASNFSQGVFNIYNLTTPAGPFVYPPLAYFSLGLIYLPLRILGGEGFSLWLSMGNIAYEVDNLYRYIFLLKVPFFIILILCSKLVDSKYRMLFLLNPISLYVVGVLGQIDLLAVVLTLIALKVHKSHPVTAGICLGLGGAIKSYPLLLLPFLIIYIPSLKAKVLTLLASIASYSLWVLPYLSTPSFYNATLTSNLSLRLFNLTIPFINIPLIPTVLIALWLIIFSKKYKPNLSESFKCVLLVVLSGIKLHPQWAIWAMPFIITSPEVKSKNPLFIWFCISYFLNIFTIPDNFISINTLSPIIPALTTLPPLISFLPSNITSMFSTMAFVNFALCSYAIIFFSFKNAKHSTT